MNSTVPQIPNFDVVRKLTVAFLIVDVDKEYFLRFDTGIEPDKTTFSERVRKSKDGAQQNAEPMHIATVTNIVTGEVNRLVAHQVLESTLTEGYPDASYVGKIFQIKKSKQPGKRYFNFDVTEIKLKTAAPATQTVASKK